MITIYINASSVAAACALNKYKTQKETIVEVWKSNFPSESKSASKINVMSKEYKNTDESNIISFATEIVKASAKTEIENVMVAKANLSIDHTDVAKAKLVEACIKLAPDIGETVIEKAAKKHINSTKIEQILTSETKQTIAKDRGIKREASDLDTYQVRSGRDVKRRNTETRTKIILNHDNVILKICGRPDGFDSDGNICETKHRKNWLFNMIPIREKVQMEVYMWLTGINTCVHIENFDEEQNITHYTHDEDLWKTIQSKLKTFCKKFKSFYNGDNKLERANEIILNGINKNAKRK